MLVKQTVWLFVKALVIGGTISLYLAYMANQPADHLIISQRLAAIVFW
jgi:hypothetical protein